MGTKGKAVVKLNLSELIEKLNKAFADEWLAYYQYWIGAKVVRGSVSKQIAIELEEHASDELKHANMLAERIIQLDGKLILKPEDWYKMSNCGFEAPENPSQKIILQQNIQGERCAIAIYDKLLDLTKDKDPITHNMIIEILKEEIEHEQDLQVIFEDLP